ncbi:MAG: hypothetical protein GEU80_17090 [Dehalococcoidia bacterium]|nr:hypothetical protein [Dehalococcoidia bacterium]
MKRMTAAELREEAEYVRSMMADTFLLSGTRRVYALRLNALEARIERTEQEEREATEAAAAHAAAERERWAGERDARRAEYVAAGGDEATFDREWPAMKSRLINEGIEAQRNHPQLHRPRL